MALYPATYVVYLLGPSSPSLPSTTNGQAFLTTWAWTYSEAAKKARKLCPKGYKIDRIDRKD